MWRRVVVWFFFFLLGKVSLFAQGNVLRTFSWCFYSVVEGVSRGVDLQILDSAGDLLILGVYVGDEFMDPYLLRVSPGGKLRWATLWTPVEAGISPAHMAVTPGGSEIWITGNLHWKRRREILLVRADSLGKPRKAWRIHGAFRDLGYRIFPTTSGGFLLAGYTSGWSFGYQDILFLWVRRDGEVYRARVLGTRFPDFPAELFLLPDGGIMVVGAVEDPGNEHLYAFALHLDSTGKLLWQRIFRGPGNQVLTAGVLVGDSLLILGGSTQSWGEGGDDLWLVALDTAGTFRWSKTIGSAGDERAIYMIAGKDGWIYTVGVIEGEEEDAPEIPEKEKVLLMRFSPDEEEFQTWVMGTATGDRPVVIRQNTAGYMWIVGKTIFPLQYEDEDEASLVGITGMLVMGLEPGGVFATCGFSKACFQKKVSLRIREIDGVTEGIIQEGFQEREITGKVKMKSVPLRIAVREGNDESSVWVRVCGGS